MILPNDLNEMCLKIIDGDAVDVLEMKLDVHPCTFDSVDADFNFLSTRLVHVIGFEGLLENNRELAVSTAVGACVAGATISVGSSGP